MDRFGALSTCLVLMFLTFSSAAVPSVSKDVVCQVYTGDTCAKYLQNQTVFVAPDLSIEMIEERLKAAYGVIKESKDMHQHCSNYALPSLCLNVLPVCRTPEETNARFLKWKQQQQPTPTTTSAPSPLLPTSQNQQDRDNMKRKKRKNKPKSKTKGTTTATTSTTTILPPMDEDDFIDGTDIIDSLSQLAEEFSRNTEDLRRICRTECELLENELCQQEYAIAKRHPTIGQKLNLETCHDLPLNTGDCLSLGITIDARPNETCYTELGMSYRGTKSVTISGKSCLRWSLVIAKEIPQYPELAGQNYCRNPGGSHSQPWCYVVNEKQERDVELCDVDKCFNEWLSYAMIFAVVLMLICILFMYIICRCTVKKRTVTSIENINLPNVDKNIYGNSRMSSPGGAEMAALMAQVHPNGGLTMTHIRTQQNCVPHYSLRDVKFVEELGEGAFGKVYKGELTKANGDKLFVAVKALKENALPKQQQDFRREIELISDLKHDNIVCILGVVLNEEPMCMLFEYMVQGDLHEFLIGNSPTESPPGLSQAQFFSIAIQICDGMEFLAAHHYVHRDLAARNCLVGENLTVKISDFGLSRDIYSSDYYRVQTKSLLPVRWMPSESILYGKFTAESDVWSYGVVLWEIYSYGLQPYYGYSNQEVINMVRARQLLPCPEACPSAVYTLMVECWHEQPIRRPNFTEIGQRLRVWQQSQKKNSAFSGREHAHQLSSVNGSQSHLMHSLPRKIPQSCSQHSLNRNGGMGTNNLSLERGRNNAHFHPRNPGYPPLPPDSASASLRRMQQHQAQLQQQQFQQQQQQQAQHFYHPNK